MANLTNLTANAQAVVKIFASVFKSGVSNDLITQGAALLDAGATKAQVYNGLLTNANVAAAFPLYTNASTPTAFVGSLVDNVFANSGATTAYLDAVKANWTARLNTEYAGNRGNFMDAVLSAVMSSANATSTDSSIVAVYNTINNRAEVGATMALTGTSTFTTMSALQAQTATVTSDVATVAAAIAGTTSGSTFTLTTGIDNVTSSYSTVSAVVDQTTTTNTTWGLSDTVATATGGTINLTLLNGTGVNTAGYNSTGATTLKIKSVDQNTAAWANGFDVAGMTGLTKVSVANSSVVGTTADTLTLSSLASTTSLDLNTNGQYLNTTVTGKDWTGAADTLTVTVAGRNGALALGTGVETVAVTTTGDAARLASLASQTTATNKTVTVAGTGLKVDAVMDTTITSFDASNSTGAVNVFLAPGSTLTSAKGGSGTADVLAVNALSTTQTVSGFEKLIAEATGTYNLTNVTGVTTLGVDAVSTGAISFTNAAATTDTISFSGAAQRTTAPAATGNLTFVNSTLGYALKTATGTTDTLKITVDNGGTATTGTATVAAGAITATAVENITVTAADWKATTFSGLTMAGTGTAALNLTAAATASNLTFGTIAMTHGAAATTPDVIDLGAVTGTTSETVSGTGALTFSGGTGVDTVVQSGAIADLNTQTYNLGAGADVITIKSALAAATSVAVFNGDAGDDTFTLDGATTSVGTFTINGGEGTGDTLKVTGTANTKTLTSTISGIEKINFEVTGAAPTTLALTVAAGYADTVLITNVGANAENIAVTSTGSVNLSNWTQLGMTAGTDVVSVTGSGTIKGMAAYATTLTGSTAADIFTGGTGTDTYVISQANSNTTAGIDTISNFVGGTDVLDLTTAGAGTVNTASTNADVFNNSVAVASTGTTVTTLLANLQTAGDALAANAFDQTGDTFVVQITGASYSGTDAYYVVQNDGANTTVTAADTIIALIGTSTAAITVATIV